MHEDFFLYAASLDAEGKNPPQRGNQFTLYDNTWSHAKRMFKANALHAKWVFNT